MYICRKNFFWGCYCFVFIFCLWAPALSSQNSLHSNSNKTLRPIKASSVRETLLAIETQTGYRFVYDVALIENLNQKIEIDEKSLTKSLDQLAQRTGLGYKIDGENIILYKASSKDDKKSEPQGAVRGSVTDDSGETMPGANLRFVGTSFSAVTDAKGNYSITLPQGTYTVEISYVSYQTKQVTNLPVNPGKTTNLNIILDKASVELKDMVVSAEYNRATVEALITIQKNALSMTDGISSDLIKKTTANNIAQVLQKIPGVTVEKGKFVNVRGMSERYNNVQLNGSSVPSTEPNRRNFSFDVIPAALVDNITVNKTFTPDLPGEFVGGLVQVNTLSLPDNKFLNVSAGTSYNTESTGKDYYSNQRFTSDWFLGETDDRLWFDGIIDSEDDEYLSNATTNSNAQHKNTWGMNRYTAKPFQTYSISAGLPLDLGNGHKIGAVAAVTYRHEETHDYQSKMLLRTRDSLLSPANIYKEATAVGAVANIGWQKGGNKISWNNLYNNRFSHSNYIRHVFDYYDENSLYENYSVVLIGNLMQTQLKGEHDFLKNKLKLTWNADMSKATRTNPDDRYALGLVTNIDENGNYWVDWTFGINDNIANVSTGHLMYSKLEETKKNIAANLEYKFTALNNEHKLKAGYMYTNRVAHYKQCYLRPSRGGSKGAPLHEFYDYSYFADSTMTYVDAGTSLGGGYYYDGTQDIDAAYLMGDFSFLQKLHLIGGLRMEKASTHAESEATVDIDSVNYLPSLSLIYNITPKINLRAAYSQTLARPDFRELSTCSYYNVDDRSDYEVYDAIDETHCKNYDLRAEWYPGAGEIISVSAFYKDFTNPVENIAVTNTSGTDYIIYTWNLKKSTLKGVELNFRKSLGFIAPPLTNLYVSGNAVIQNGDITFSELGYQNRTRPLQGLTPFVVNAGLSYQGKRFGAAADYSREGRKLVIGGYYPKTDEYENPRDVVNLQLTALFLEGKLEIKANLADLLHQDFIVYRNGKWVQYTPTNPNPETGDTSGAEIIDLTGNGLDYNPGDWVMSRIQRGSTFSLSMSYKF